MSELHLLQAILAAAVISALVGLLLGPLLRTLDQPIRAEAAEAYQNDHWCREIAAGRMEVVGPQGDLQALCASWGVSL